MTVLTRYAKQRTDDLIRDLREIDNRRMTVTDPVTPAVAVKPAVETTDGLTQADKDFWERAFIAVLPTAMTVQGWKFGEQKISSGDDRSRLAAFWADDAVLEHRARFSNVAPTMQGESE
jgi:hypothetical protein